MEGVTEPSGSRNGTASGLEPGEAEEAARLSLPSGLRVGSGLSGLSQQESQEDEKHVFWGIEREDSFRVIFG